MGKWLVFIAAAAVAGFAFLSWRKRAQAAMNGTASTTPAPAGATYGGTLASLTAPPRAEPANVGVAIPAPPAPPPLGGATPACPDGYIWSDRDGCLPRMGSTGGAFGKVTSGAGTSQGLLSKAFKVASSPEAYARVVAENQPKAATSALPPVGQGTVAPSKPATAAQPSPLLGLSFVLPGQSFHLPVNNAAIASSSAAPSSSSSLSLPRIGKFF